MLIAMPTMGDERFARSVIYMCAHSTEGAMGIVVNQPAPHITFPDLLVQLDVVPAADLIQLPAQAGDVRVLKGGPVEPQRGFVLHSSDFFIENSTLPIDEGDLPHRDARHPQGDRARQWSGRAPCWRSAMPAGRRASSKTRSKHNGWLHCDADADLIFGRDTERKYEQALRKIGIDLGMLSSEAGHA